MRGPSCFMKSVWRDLSSDILEKVLTFLPIASLCRFRTVSKEWNRLIGDPDFAARHARASSPEEYVLTTLRYDNSFDSQSGWEVLDVANKRSFRLRDDFVDEYVLKEHSMEDLASHYISDDRATLAADGGLFCVAYFYHGDCEILLLFNPVLRTVKELPTFSRLIYNQPTVVMSTDRVSMEYEIFVINHAEDDNEDHPIALNIYESKTGRWMTASFASQLLSCIFEARSCCPVSTFVKNAFYRVIFKQIPSLEYSGIGSCDKVAGVVTVSDLDIDIPCDGDENQLVISKDQLFCVTINEILFPYTIEIFEIILARKECIWFTEMPGEVLDWLRDGVSLSNTIASTGCADSILFHSRGGRSVAYCLSTESWHRFPDGRNLGGDSRYCGGHEQEFYASSYCLSLCAP